MGKVEEYKKKIIDDVDSLEKTVGGISPTSKACANYGHSPSCALTMFQTCSTCKHYKEIVIKNKKVSFCTL